MLPQWSKVDSNRSVISYYFEGVNFCLNPHQCLVPQHKNCTWRKLFLEIYSNTPNLTPVTYGRLDVQLYSERNCSCFCWNDSKLHTFAFAVTVSTRTMESPIGTVLCRVITSINTTVRPLSISYSIKSLNIPRRNTRLTKISKHQINKNKYSNCTCTIKEVITDIKMNVQGYSKWFSGV